MLDERDLQAIRGVVKSEVDTAIQANNVTLLAEIDVRMDQKFAFFDQKIDRKLAKLKDEIITSVGDMLEQNIFPQLETINRRLDQHDKILGWQQ